MLKNTRVTSQSASSAEEPAEPLPVSLAAIRERMSQADDVIYTEYIINPSIGLGCTVVFIDGMVSSAIAYDHVLQPLMTNREFAEAPSGQVIINSIMSGSIYHSQRKLCSTKEEALSQLLFGSLLIFFDKCDIPVAFDSKGFEKRGISEAMNENIVKGSRESFVEVIRVNTSIIRRHILTDELKIRHLTVGRRTRTSVAIVYLEGIANSSTVEKVFKKFEDADIDGLTTAGQVESLLYDNPISMLPQSIYTERPDKLSGSLLEGRIGILIDGLSIVYITPIDFHSLMQAPEDYAHNFVFASFFRMLRYLCTAASIVLPAFYVSITTFHQEMIPTKLAVSIISSKRGAPFPTYMEVLLMLTAFEVLLEAGLRLPKSVGQAISIVGALVVGQAAITANILSPGVVIIIAAAGITGFIVPSQDLSNFNRLIRIFFVLLAMIGGLFTTTMGLIAIIYLMCTIEVFGTPYFSPIVAADGHGAFRDTFIRRKWSSMTRRPGNIDPEDIVRNATKPEDAPAEQKGGDA